MNMNLIHVGLDVDDTQHHGSALDKSTVQDRCMPTIRIHQHEILSQDFYQGLVMAYRSGDYSMSAIVDMFGVHYSTLSRAVILIYY